jgi:hypothetical protein
MVAQVAADEPDTEPKMPQPRMVVCISRPGMLFNHGRRPSNISSDSLVRNRISPIQMNRGRAASSQLALLSQKAENRLLPGEVVVKNAWPTQPQMASVMAIQTPPESSTIMTSSSRPPTRRMSMEEGRAARSDVGGEVALARGAVPRRRRRWACRRAAR